MMFKPTVCRQPTLEDWHLSPAIEPYRVLLVEDNQRTCQLIEDILQEYSDLQIIGRARDGKEAVELATRRRPDVVLMDVNLPLLDGVHATCAIIETCPNSVVIGMSEHFTPSAYSAMRTAGAAAFASKSELLGLHQTILNALQNPLTSALKTRFHFGAS
jgi:DNA-binding NarL/FixJ family response regulator